MDLQVIEGILDQLFTSNMIMISPGKVKDYAMPTYKL